MINQALIRLSSKAFRWLHKSCASNITQDHKTNIDFDKCSNDLNWHKHQSELNAILPGQCFWAYIASQRKKQFWLCGISEYPVSPLIVGLPFMLPTRVKITIFSKSQLICCKTNMTKQVSFSNKELYPISDSKLFNSVSPWQWRKS